MATIHARVHARVDLSAQASVRTCSCVSRAPQKRRMPKLTSDRKSVVIKVQPPRSTQPIKVQPSHGASWRCQESDCADRPRLRAWDCKGQVIVRCARSISEKINRRALAMQCMGSSSAQATHCGHPPPAASTITHLVSSTFARRSATTGSLVKTAPLSMLKLPTCP